MMVLLLLDVLWLPLQLSMLTKNLLRHLIGGTRTSRETLLSPLKVRWQILTQLLNSTMIPKTTTILLLPNVLQDMPDKTTWIGPTSTLVWNLTTLFVKKLTQISKTMRTRNPWSQEHEDLEIRAIQEHTLHNISSSSQRPSTHGPGRVVDPIIRELIDRKVTGVCYAKLNKSDYKFVHNTDAVHMELDKLVARWGKTGFSVHYEPPTRPPPKKYPP